MAQNDKTCVQKKGRNNQEYKDGFPAYTNGIGG